MKFYDNQLYGFRFKISKSFFKAIANETYAVVKGQPLSMYAYGNIAHRVSGDIDILIPKNRVSSFGLLLRENGFLTKSCSRQDRIMCISSSHQLPPYNRGIVEIDINFDIFWGEYKGKRVDINEFLSDTIEMNIYDCRIKTLQPLKAMIQLILHHYKDMNSIFLLATRKSIRRDMFDDVYYLLKNNTEAILLDKLYQVSEEYEIIPYVYYVLYYTGCLFDDVMLKEYISAFKTPEGVMLLNCYGLNESERRGWKYDFMSRLESDNLYDLIKDDLTDKDRDKIAINKKVFLGE